jgi:hypothetical protein
MVNYSIPGRINLLEGMEKLKELIRKILTELAFHEKNKGSRASKRGQGEGL